ncbi:MAG: hypothetical protein NVS9B6_19220 [Candidatus Limnocylindrales bacterium]
MLVRFGVLLALAVYSAGAALLLALGLGSALATVPAVQQAFVASDTGGVLGPLFLAMARAARLAEPAPLIVLDYLLTAGNVGIAMFLLWRRPNETLTRLLAFALIGTAAAFNYQAHGVIAVSAAVGAADAVPAVRYLNVLHFVLHAVGGAAYVHALLVFPDGRLPRRLIWAPIALYAIAVEESAVAIFGLFSGEPRYGLIKDVFTRVFDVRPLADFNSVIESEVTFFVLLTGVLIPLLGIPVLVGRYRTSATADRAPIRLVLSGLLTMLAIGVVVLIVSAGRVLAGDAPAGDVVEEAVVRTWPALAIVVPLSLLLSVVRHRFLGIELVVDRTLVYAPVTGLLALAFLGTLWITQQLLHGVLGGPTEVAVVVAAGINAALFRPAERRVRAAVQRRLVPVERHP